MGTPTGCKSTIDGFPGVGDVGSSIRPAGEIGAIIDPREYATAGGHFYVTLQEVGGGAFRCYLQSREILYSRDDRVPEAKAKAKAKAKAAVSAQKLHHQELRVSAWIVPSHQRLSLNPLFLRVLQGHEGLPVQRKMEHRDMPKSRISHGCQQGR